MNRATYNKVTVTNARTVTVDRSSWPTLLERAKIVYRDPDVVESNWSLSGQDMITRRLCLLNMGTYKWTNQILGAMAYFNLVSATFEDLMAYVGQVYQEGEDSPQFIAALGQSMVNDLLVTVIPVFVNVVQRGLCLHSFDLRHSEASWFLCRRGG